MPVLIDELGDYNRCKCDPDWGLRDETCKHCGHIKAECEPMSCASCGTETCSESLLCDHCDELDAAVSQGCQFCRGPMWQCWEVSCARCGETGCCKTLAPKEGDDWECPPCNERENKRERGL